MVQKQKLQEEDFRGELFKDHKTNLKNNNDILTLTQPHIIEEIFSVIHFFYFYSNTVKLAQT